MEYIILAAGVGTRLHPYTKNTPKCLVNVTKNETVIERCVRLLNKYDKEAHITIVLGFCADQIKEKLGKKCDYIVNPFYRITNSVASLWFAKDILSQEKPTVILNADIVFSDSLAKIITEIPNISTVYYDSSIKTNGDYNVQQLDGYVVAMSKELPEYDGEYVGITKYTPDGVKVLLDEVNDMVYDELYDNWYENGLVQLSLTLRYKFIAEDVCEHMWSEIDAIDNLLKIRQIISREK